MARRVQTNERQAQTSGDEWRRMRDQCRGINMNQRQTRGEHRRVKTSEDDWETSADK